MNPSSPYEENHWPVRRTADLVHGRASLSGATYFLTLCTKDRRPGLTTRNVSAAIRAAFEASQRRGDIVVVAATIMPDHVHALVRLGGRLRLPRVVGSIKATSRMTLASTQLEWQGNFYDHHLRRETSLEEFALYIFLNPYRAQLIDPKERWPHSWRTQGFRFKFEQTLEECGAVPPEWFDRNLPVGAAD